MIDVIDWQYRFRTLTDEARAALPEAAREKLAHFLEMEARTIR